MTQTGYSQYETDTNDIPTSILTKLAVYYDTSIDYLLYLTDEKKPYKKSIIYEEKDTPASKNPVTEIFKVILL